MPRFPSFLRVNNYVWDGISAWVKETQAGSGGGGGASTIANGADVALGSTTDTAVTGDNTGTVSAKLRGLSKMLSDMWDSVNHRLKVNVENTSLATTSMLGIPAHDYAALAQTSATVETWTYKSGGSGGSTVATLTITYSDSTREFIDHYAKT